MSLGYYVKSFTLWEFVKAHALTQEKTKKKNRILANSQIIPGT